MSSFLLSALKVFLLRKEFAMSLMLQVRKGNTWNLIKGKCVTQSFVPEMQLKKNEVGKYLEFIDSFTAFFYLTTLSAL